MKRYIILLMAILFSVLFFIGVACAEEYAVLVVTDDRMESSIDEQNRSLQQTIEVYVSFLETSGNTVDVYGSVRGKGKTAVVYSNESKAFNWENSETGKNDSYFRWSLYQLDNKKYDTIVVITGQLRTEQVSIVNPVSFASNPETKVIVYGTEHMPNGKSLEKVYQYASGAQFDSAGINNENGFKSIGNARIKENEKFDANTTLFDLINVSYDGSMALDQNGIIIPKVLAKHAILILEGKELSSTKIIINEKDIYNIGADGKNWYGQTKSLGQDEICFVRIPDDISGEMKLSGQGRKAYIYYEKNPQFDELLQKTNLTLDGLEYSSDGAVIINRSKDEIFLELKSLYPQISFQALVTPLDGSNPFTIISDNCETINWENPINVDANILVSLRSAPENQEVLLSQSFDYQPIKTLLDSLQPNVFQATEKTVLSKREEIEYSLQLTYPEYLDENEKKRIDDFINKATVQIVDGDSNQINGTINKNEEGTIVISALKAPSVSGEYSWNVVITEPTGYKTQYTRNCALPSFTVENHKPISHPELMERNISKKIQPGNEVKINIPSDLFTDEDGDDLTVHYTVYYKDAIVQESSFVVGSNGQEGYQIAGLNEFGKWIIELSAEDNEGSKSDDVNIDIEITDGNTAPYLNMEKIPDDDKTIPLLNLNEYNYILPEGLFADDEGNTITVYVKMYDQNGDEYSYEYSGENGKSPQWKQRLSQFGTWNIELYAEDEYGMQSDTFSYRLTLADALSNLDGVLRTVPEQPRKGKNIRLELELTWPEEYSDLPIREWLQECDIIVRGTDRTEYPMHLSGNALILTTDEILMPNEETEISYSVSIKSKDGVEPQKTFTKYNTVSFTISNSAPVSSYVNNKEEHSAIVFNVDDYQLSVPRNIFSDPDDDEFTVSILYEDEKGNVIDGPAITGDEQTNITVPAFGKWVVKAKATDKYNKSSETVILYNVNVRDLKLILIISGGAVVLLGTIVFFIIRHNIEKKKARFTGNEYIVFKVNETPVSKHIKMKAEDSRFIPLTVFAFAINVLLTDTQWSNLKKWAIYPTHDDKPIFKEIKNVNEEKHMVDLGDGLSVYINE